MSHTTAGTHLIRISYEAPGDPQTYAALVPLGVDKAFPEAMSDAVWGAVALLFRQISAGIQKSRVPANFTVGSVYTPADLPERKSATS